MIRRDPNGESWKLVRRGTRAEVVIGDIVKNAKGEEAEVRGALAPGDAGCSGGAILVEGHTFAMYVGLWGCLWVPHPDCPDSSDGKHEPDPTSLSYAVKSGDIADINCKHCGCSGSFTIPFEDINW